MNKKIVGWMTLTMALVTQVAMAGYGTLTLGEYAQLPDCGGTIKVSTSKSGSREQVNIQLNDVVNCSNFDILSSNGDQVIYAVKKLGGKHMSRAGSYTIPRDLIEYGVNSIKIRLNSNTGVHSDTVRVEFAKVSVRQSPPVVVIPPTVVVTPSAGGSY